MKIYYTLLWIHIILKAPFLFLLQINICACSSRAVLNSTFYVSQQKGFLLKICMHCELRHKNEILICSAIMYNIFSYYTNTNSYEQIKTILLVYKLMKRLIWMYLKLIFSSIATL